MKIHLKNSSGNYSCNRSFNQMPISDNISREKFEIELIKNSNILCKRCIAIIKKGEKMDKIKIENVNYIKARLHAITAEIEKGKMKMSIDRSYISEKLRNIYSMLNIEIEIKNFFPVRFDK